MCDEGLLRRRDAVTAAALISVAVFASFIPSGSTVLKPITVALAVFIDGTFQKIIRERRPARTGRSPWPSPATDSA